MSKLPTLREVAENAGVSLPTASRALNNKDNVLPETRARVLKAAAELGYKLQLRAPNTVPAKLTTVGVVLKRDPGEVVRIDAFNYAILSGIEDECQRLSLNLMYANVQVDEYGHAVAWPAMLEGNAIDGLLMVGAFFERTILSISDKLTVPMVLVDAYAPEVELDAVLIDNVNSAKRAVDYLIQHGHRHIGLVGFDPYANQHVSIQERHAGYLQALHYAGIHDTYVESSLLNGASTYEATQRLLTRAPQVTAIFACNDDVGLSVVTAAQDMGLKIPEQLSVIGFDDTEQAVQVQPQLTTMRVNTLLLGSIAVRQLYDQASRERSVKMTTRIDTELIIRDSVSHNREQNVNGDRQTKVVRAL